LWRVLCCFFAVLFFINPVYAGSNDSRQWDVPFLGMMIGPEGFTAVDMEQYMQQLEPILNANMQKKDGNIPVAKVGGLEKMQLPPEIKVYQLQVEQGNIYHIAWAVAFEDKGNSAAPIDNYFTREQERFMEEMNGLLLTGIKKVEEESEKTGFFKVRVLNLMPLSQLEGSTEVIYTVGGRLIVDSKGLIAPLYGKAYFLNRGGKLASAIIFTTDADGGFWGGIADQLLLSVIH